MQNSLQIAEKRREAKGKGEQERYTHLNAEFHRIAKRDKKAFLSDQRKETEENNRMGNACKPMAVSFQCMTKSTTNNNNNNNNNNNKEIIQIKKKNHIMMIYQPENQ